MEIPSEIITEFFALNKSKKFNIIITIFATIISGFILVLSTKPDLLKVFSSFKIILLSIALIAPIYLFNQAITIFLVSKTSKLGLKKLISFAELPPDSDDSVNKFTDGMAKNIALKVIYSSPARQVAEISTIISSYLAAFIGYLFHLKILAIYIILTFCSVLVMYLTYKLLSAMISALEPEHLKPLVEKLKKDDEFKNHLKTRLDRIEKIIKEKKGKTLA